MSNFRGAKNPENDSLAAFPRQADKPVLRSSSFASSCRTGSVSLTRLLDRVPFTSRSVKNCNGKTVGAASVSSSAVTEKQGYFDSSELPRCRSNEFSRRCSDGNGFCAAKPKSKAVLFRTSVPGTQRKDPQRFGGASVAAKRSSNGSRRWYSTNEAAALRSSDLLAAKSGERAKKSEQSSPQYKPSDRNLASSVSTEVSSYASSSPASDSTFVVPLRAFVRIRGKGRSSDETHSPSSKQDKSSEAERGSSVPYALRVLQNEETEGEEVVGGVRKQVLNSIDVKRNATVLAPQLPRRVAFRDCRVNAETIFEVDGVFDESAKQADVYQAVAAPLVRSLLRGREGCVIAYGASGTGKTFSMIGSKVGASVPLCASGGGEDDKDSDGLVPRALENLFDELELQREDACQTTLQLSILEVQGNFVRDLLQPFRVSPKRARGGFPSIGPRSQRATSSGASNHDKKDRVANDVEIPPQKGQRKSYVACTSVTSPGKTSCLRIRELNCGKTVVQGLSSRVVRNREEAMQVLKLGIGARANGRSSTNLHSSRSHLIIRVTLCRNLRGPFESSLTVNQGSDSAPYTSAPAASLYFVDLAGAERVSSSLASSSASPPFRTPTSLKGHPSKNSDDVSVSVTGSLGSSFSPYQQQDEKCRNNLKEGSSINSALTVLGKVIEALASITTSSAVQQPGPPGKPPHPSSNTEAAEAVPLGGGKRRTCAPRGGRNFLFWRSTDKRCDEHSAYFVGADLVKTDRERNSQSLSGRPAKHIPFRESKLTRILKDPLIGHGTVSLLCTCSDTLKDHMHTTLATLKFATRAMQVKPIVRQSSLPSSVSETPSCRDPPTLKGAPETPPDAVWVQLLSASQERIIALEQTVQSLEMKLGAVQKQKEVVHAEVQTGDQKCSCRWEKPETRGEFPVTFCLEEVTKHGFGSSCRSSSKGSYRLIGAEQPEPQQNEMDGAADSDACLCGAVTRTSSGATFYDVDGWHEWDGRLKGDDIRTCSLDNNTSAAFLRKLCEARRAEVAAHGILRQRSLNKVEDRDNIFLLDSDSSSELMTRTSRRTRRRSSSGSDTVAMALLQDDEVSEYR